VVIGVQDDLPQPTIILSLLDILANLTEWVPVLYSFASLSPANRDDARL